MSVKISELTAADSLTGTEEVPLVQSSSTKKTTKKITVNDLLPVQLQGDKQVDLNAHKLYFINGSVGVNGVPDADIIFQVFSGIIPVFYATEYGIVSNTSEADHTATLFVSSDENNSKAQILLSDNIGSGGLEIHSDSDDGYKFTINAGDGNNQVSIDGDAVDNSITHTAGNHIFPDLVAKNFANDGAAASGGVPIGALYHTSGTLKIRLV